MDTRTMVRLAGAMGACALIGWFPFVRGTRVPILGLFDFGMHELGHLLFIWAGKTVHFLAGSVVQVLVPLGLAVAFWVWGNLPASAILLAWTGASLWDASVYIADAPYQRLPLIGGEHDWATLLGGWDAIDQAAAIAGVVRGVGLVAVLASLVVCVLPALVDGFWEPEPADGPSVVERWTAHR